MNKWLRKLSSKLKMAVLVSGLLVAQVAGATAPFIPSSITPVAHAANCEDNNCNNDDTPPPSSVANPALPTSCGLDIAFVLDVSGSINATQLSQMKSAMTGVVTALNGTPTEFSVTKFDTTASVAQSFSGNAATVNAAINGLSGGGYTNWQDGLLKGNSTLPNRVNPNLVIFASDGQPNTTGNGPGGNASPDGSAAAVNPAIVAANTIKSGGTRVLGIGIGLNAAGTANMKSVTGPNADTGSFLTSDLITTNFSTLASQMATFASETCGGTVTVTKVIDADGNPDTTNDQTPASGWTFNVGGQAGKVTDANGKTPAVTLTAGDGYSVAETQQDGYKLMSANCSGATSNGSLNGNAVTDITISNKNVVSCKFINTPAKGTIKVTKMVNNSNGGNASAGDFPLFIGKTPVTSGATNNFTANQSYTVSETANAVAGYAQTSLSCVDSTNPNTNLGANFTLKAGQNVSCTITNSDTAPTLKLVKNVVGGGSAHDWTLTAATNPAHPSLSGKGDSFGTQTAYAGIGYHLSESGPVGYTASSWTCKDGNNQTVPVGVESNKIVLALGQNVTCTITNMRDTGTVKVIKQLKPANDNGRFDLHINGPTNYTAYNQGNAGSTGTRTVGTGSYTVSETAYNGTSLTNYASNYVCMDGNNTVATGNGTASTSFNVAKDHSVICTFTNTRYGSIDGTKYEVNANGQHVAVIGGIQICIDNNHDNKCDVNETTTTTDGSGHFSFSHLLAGTYSLIENIGNGWSQIFGDGNVTLSDGQNAIHDFGNFKNGSISGYKWNDLNGNGSKQENENKISNWTIKLYKGDALLKTIPTDGYGNYNFTNLAPGTYTVCEGSKAGWVQTFPGNNGCYTIVIDQSGESNPNKNFGNQGRGAITVIKNVDDGFGKVSPNVANWNWDVDGGMSHATGSNDVVGVAAGNHTVSEHQKPGYHVTSSSCRNDSDHGDFEFNFFNNDRDNHPSTSEHVSVGPGDHIVCTFTNTRDTGTITVIKNVNDGFGNVTKDVKDWTWNVDEESNHTTGSDKAVKFVTGKYTVTENQKDGYHVTASSCHNTDQGDEHDGDNRDRIGFLFVQNPSTSVDVNLHYNDHIVCTFTNTRDTGNVSVTKVLFPANDSGKFNLQVDGKTVVANVGNGGTTGAVLVTTGLHSVGETAGTGTNLADYNSTYSCTNGRQAVVASGSGTTVPTFTVNKGDSVSCTFTNQHKVVPQVLGASTSAGQLTNTGLPIVAFTLAAMTLLGTALFVGTSRRKSS